MGPWMLAELDRRRRALLTGLLGGVALLVVALVLLGAGAVGLADEVPPQSVVAVDPAEEAAPGEVHHEPLVERSPADPSSLRTGEPGVAKVRMQQRLGTNPRPYTGSLTVFADAIRIGQREIVNNDPIVFDVPAGVGSLRFVAPGHAPVSVSWPFEVFRYPRPATVVLEPTSGLRFSMVGLAAADDPLLQLTLTGAAMHGSLRTSGSACNCVQAPVPAGVAFTWNVALQIGAKSWSWTHAEPPLAIDERRVVELNLTAKALRRHRLVGISAPLRALLEVHRDHYAGGEPRSERMHFDDAGQCELMPLPGATFRCAHNDLRAEELPDETLLHADGKLLALGWLDVDGNEQKTRLFGADGRDLGMEKPLHVVVRGGEHEPAWIGPTFPKATAVAVDRLPTDRDVVWLPWTTKGRPGRVALAMSGTEPESHVASQCSITVHVEGKHVTTRWPVREEFSLALPTGRLVSLRWRVGTRDGEWLAQDLRLAADEVRTLPAVWPVGRLWRGTVAGHTELSESERWHRVSWGTPGPSSPLGQGFVRILGDGKFELTLPADGELPSVWSLFHGQTLVVAEVVACDRERATFTVQPRGDVVRVLPKVELAPPWLLLRFDVKNRCPSHFGSHDDQRPRPLLAGDVVHGVAMRDRQAVAWFSLDAHQPVVRDLGGRTLELRPAFEKKEKWICLVGPQGQWGMGQPLFRGQPLAVFVPAGTRGLIVFDEDHPDAEPVELPLPAAGPFVIE